ncbi:MAG: tetratricopeptide repeat protein [Candidatus Promineifilaceae bacterium]
MTSKTELISIVKSVFRQYRRYLQRYDIGVLSEGWLAESVLIEAYWLAGDVQTAEAKGYAVEALLYWVAERLRAEGQPSWVDHEWRLYNIVYHYYLRGGKVSDLVAQMGIGESAFYKSVKQTIGIVAELLAREAVKKEDFFGRKQAAITRRYNRLSPDLQTILNQLAILRTPAPLELFDGKCLQVLHQHNLVILTEQASIHPEIQSVVAEWVEPTIKITFHSDAAERYVADHAYLEASYHYRLANRMEQAIDLLLAHQEQIFAEEVMERLQIECRALRGVSVSAEKKAQLQLIIGRVALWLENGQSAEKAFRQAIGSSDSLTRAAAHYYLGKTLQTNRVDAALQHFAQAIQLLAGRVHAILVQVYIDRAWIFLRERVELVSAEANLTQAQTCLKQLPRDPMLESSLYSVWARFSELQGGTLTAIEHAWRAWQLAHEVRTPRRIMNTAHNLGVLYFNQQQATQALPYFTECLEQARKTNNGYFVGSSLMHMGGCYYLLSDYVQAQQLYQQAYDYFSTLGVGYGHVACCYNLAELLVETGEVATAQQFYAEGIALVRSLKMDTHLQQFEAMGEKFVELSAELDIYEPEMINYTRRHHKITNKAACILLPITERQVLRILRDLCKKGFLQRQGKGRSTHYILVC